MAHPSPSASDWSSTQYLKFNDERTIPVHDLISKIPLSKPSHIIDLGCGPGNSTSILVDRFQSSKITGMDSSPDMIEKAKRTLPGIEFSLADLDTYQLDPSADLLFSNAVFQWLDADQRLPIIKDRLLTPLRPGSVLAFQVPDNFEEPSHVLMRETAKEFSHISGMSFAARPKFLSPETLYDELKPLCSNISIWHTIYNHVLKDHDAIIEWVKGTGLRPFLDLLGPEDKKVFLEGYLERLRGSGGYRRLMGGGVILRYPRLFVVAVKG